MEGERMKDLQYVEWIGEDEGRECKKNVQKRM